MPLVDTNVLVYRYDPRDRMKRERANELLRNGAEMGDLLLTHQVVLEFVAVVGRPRMLFGTQQPLLPPAEIRREVDELLAVFPVLYPNEEILRLALHGQASYQLSWFDAHLWAHAEYFGITTLLSEDFQHGRRYGHVLVVDPFLQPGSVHQPPGL